MKKSAKLLSLLMVVCMLFCSCAQSIGQLASSNTGNAYENDAGNVISNAGITNGVDTENLEASNRNDATTEKGTYNEGVALVK